MKIAVLSKLFAEGVAPVVGRPYAIISITDPTSDSATFKPNEYCRGVLFLKFYDIDFTDPEKTDDQVAVMRDYGHGLFKDDQAKQIVDFVEEIKDKVKIIICNCDAGISRSSAVAAAIQKYLTGSDKEIFNDDRYLPNMYVYRKLLNEFHGREVK